MFEVSSFSRLWRSRIYSKYNLSCFRIFINQVTKVKFEGKNRFSHFLQTLKIRKQHFFCPGTRKSENIFTFHYKQETVYRNLLFADNYALNTFNTLTDQMYQVIDYFSKVCDNLSLRFITWNEFSRARTAQPKAIYLNESVKSSGYWLLQLIQQHTLSYCQDKQQGCSSEHCFLEDSSKMFGNEGSASTPNWRSTAQWYLPPFSTPMGAGLSSADIPSCSKISAWTASTESTISGELAILLKYRTGEYWDSCSGNSTWFSEIKHFKIFEIKALSSFNMF